MKENYDIEIIDGNNQENSPLEPVFSKELYNNTLKNVPLPKKISNEYVKEIIYKDELRKFCIDNDISENTTELTKEQKQDFEKALREAQLNYPVKTDNKIDNETEKNLKEQVRTAQEEIDNTLDYIILTKLELTTETLEKAIQDFKNGYIESIINKICLIHKNKELQKQNTIKTKKFTYEKQLTKDTAEILKRYNGEIEFIEEDEKNILFKEIKTFKIKKQYEEELKKTISEYFDEKNKEGIERINEKMLKLQGDKNLKKKYEQMINEIDLKDVNNADKGNLMLIASLFLQEQYKVDKSYQLAFLYGYKVLLNLKEKILNNKGISFGAKKNIIKTDKINKKKQKVDKKKLTLAVNVKEDENQKPYGIKEQISSALQIALGNNQIKIYTPYIMADCHNRGYITGEELKKNYPEIYNNISEEIIKNNERSHNKLQIEKIKNMDLSKKIRLLLTKFTNDDHINNFFYKIDKNGNIEDIIQFDYDMRTTASDEGKLVHFKYSDIHSFIYGDGKRDCYYDRVKTLYKEYKKLISIDPETIIAILCYRLQKVYGSKLYKNKEKLADAIHNIYKYSLIPLFNNRAIGDAIIKPTLESFEEKILENTKKAKTEGEIDKKKGNIRNIKAEMKNIKILLDQYKNDPVSTKEKLKEIGKTIEYYKKKLEEDEKKIPEREKEIKELEEELKTLNNDAEKRMIEDIEKKQASLEEIRTRKHEELLSCFNDKDEILRKIDEYLKKSSYKEENLNEELDEDKIDFIGNEDEIIKKLIEEIAEKIKEKQYNIYNKNIDNSHINEKGANLEGADDSKQEGCCSGCSFFNSNK